MLEQAARAQSHLPTTSFERQFSIRHQHKTHPQEQRKHKSSMDEDDDLYGDTGDDAQEVDQKLADNKVDMDGNQEEEEEDSDDVRMPTIYIYMRKSVDHHM